MQPSLKGSLMLGVVVAVRRHRDRGRVAAAQLEARLGGEALDLIDRKIDVGRWYPIEPFCELLDVDWEVGGRRDPEYARRGGAHSANRLFDGGIYQQLDFAERTGKATGRERLLRQAKLITTITGALYNFLSFEVRFCSGNEHLEIVYGNAALFSEALRYTTEGFMNQINVRQESPRRWSSQRTRPDEIVFRLPLSARLASGA